MLNLDNLIWIDPYAGGQLEDLTLKVKRLERLVTLVLERKYETEQEAFEDLCRLG